LRNDYWCKGLGQTQPKSEAWKRFKEIKKERKSQISDSVNASLGDLLEEVA